MKKSIAVFITQGLPFGESLLAIRFTKRQKFVGAVVLLSLCLFISENLFGRLGILFAILLSLLTDVLFISIMYKDLKGNFTPAILILPFAYSLSCALFFFLFPARFLTRIAMVILYAIGLYSLFLSQNIFIVASIRTIALLTGARIVSFVITILSYFFLTNVILSQNFPLLMSFIFKPLLVFISSFLLVYQSFWTVTLDRSWAKNLLWVFVLALSLAEIVIALLFWPTAPKFISVFLTGFFYTIVGISHVWFDKRLFRGVMWEYLWVAMLVFCILLLSTSWKN